MTYQYRNVAFLDSCIIFNKILNEDEDRTSKFFNDVYKGNIGCMINESIKIECRDKIDDAFQYIINELNDKIWDGLKEHLNNTNRDEDSNLIYDDILKIEEIFLKKYYVPRRRRLPGYRRPFPSSIKKIEESIVYALETLLDSENTISFNKFVEEVTYGLFEFNREIDELFENFENKVQPNIQYINQFVHTVFSDALTRYRLHYPDNIHIAAAIAYRNIQRVNAVFVTTDIGILEHVDRLLDVFNFRCCNPLYAINFFKI